MTARLAGNLSILAFLFVVIDDLKISVHHVIVWFSGAASGGPRGARRTGWIFWLRARFLRSGLLVQLGTNGLKTSLQLFRCLLDSLCVGAVQLFPNLFDGVF